MSRGLALALVLGLVSLQLAAAGLVPTGEQPAALISSPSSLAPNTIAGAKFELSPATTSSAKFETAPTTATTTTTTTTTTPTSATPNITTSSTSLGPTTTLGAASSSAASSSTPSSSGESAAAAVAAAATQEQQSWCRLLGKVLPEGAPVPDEMLGKLEGEEADCERACRCQRGAIVCQPVCPVLAAEPPSDFECPESATAAKANVGCCAQWVCQEPYALRSVTARVVNASAVELTIELPLFALNQKGKIELNFTGRPVTTAAGVDLEGLDKSAPAGAIWSSRPKIRTPNGIFTKTKINYLWLELRPNHKYWFRVSVYIESKDQEEMFARPIEGALQTVTTPLAQLEPTASPSWPPTSSPSAPPTSSPSTPPPPPPPPPSSVTLVPKSSSITTTTTTTTSTTTTTTSTTTTTTTPKPTSAIPVSTSRPETTSTTSPSPSPSPSSSSSTTSTSTTTSTQRPAVSDSFSEFGGGLQLGESTNIAKPPVGTELGPSEAQPEQQNKGDTNELNSSNALPSSVMRNTTEATIVSMGQLLAEHIRIERYAWHLLVALSIMTLLFIIVSYLYCKKSRVIAPITSPHYPHHQHHHHNNHHAGHNHQSVYDNPTFTKLVSYYANKPHVLLVDETSNHQNYDNMVKQKNLDVDETSALHMNHQTNQNKSNNISSNNNNNNNNKTRDSNTCSERRIY